MQKRTLSLLFPLALVPWFVTSCGPEHSPDAFGASHVSDETFEVSPSDLTLGAFNLLRLGQNEKNLERMASIIDQADYDVFGAVEIMKVDAADELLAALRDVSGKDWRMNISTRASGEHAYREYFAIFYRADRLTPYDSPRSFCRSSYATLRSGNSCFGTDNETGGNPDFEREPFVGHYKFRGRVITLLALHIYYGSLEEEAVLRRRREMKHLERVMLEIQETTPATDIFAVGDFNLTIGRNEGRAAISEKVPQSFFDHDGVAVYGLIEEPTTVGSSNYDHIFYYETNILQPVEGSETTVLDFNKSTTAPSGRSTIGSIGPLRNQSGFYKLGSWCESARDVS